jgi:peptidyl-prolyl cis-trans isomerase C
MQRKFKNKILAIIVTIIAIFWVTATQAQDNSQTNKSTATGKSTTATKSSTTTTKSTTTDKNTTAVKSSGSVKSSSTKKTATNNGKVASVNGVAITKLQYDRAMAPVEQQVAQMGKGAVTDEQLAQVKTKILDNLIATELLYQESRKNGVVIEDNEVSETYDKQKAQFNTEAEFQKALTESKFNESAFKAQIKLGLTIQQYINKNFAQNTAISDEDVKKFYDENADQFQQPAQIKASHIMIMLDASADQAKKDDAKKQLETVLARLKAGEDFAAVAKEVSQDPYTKDKGGDLDYFSKGQMVQAFEDAAFALKPGELSSIVETDYGYHIIKVTDKKDAKTISMDESKEDIRSNLKSSKVNSDVNKYVAELKNKAKVEIFLK